MIAIYQIHVDCDIFASFHTAVWYVFHCPSFMSNMPECE